MAQEKILVVDDDEAILNVTRRTLEAAGYTVVVSNSPLRIPSLVQREKPDLILLDVEMPSLSGEHVLDFATVFDFLKQTKIVLHSSKKPEELESLVTRSQARGYIRKTSNPISLVQQVQKFLA